MIELSHSGSASARCGPGTEGYPRSGPTRPNTRCNPTAARAQAPPAPTGRPGLPARGPSPHLSYPGPLNGNFAVNNNPRASARETRHTSSVRSHSPRFPPHGFAHSPCRPPPCNSVPSRRKDHAEPALPPRRVNRDRRPARFSPQALALRDGPELQAPRCRPDAVRPSTSTSSASRDGTFIGIAQLGGIPQSSISGWELILVQENWRDAARHGRARRAWPPAPRWPLLVAAQGRDAARRPDRRARHGTRM